MSEFLQSGQQLDPRHLDPDQISALVDHALSPHEREAVLAHLAVCGECRETVALVSPPIEAAPTENVRQKRSRWFFNLSVLAPVAAAGFAAILLYVHFAAPPRGGSAGPEPQIAREIPAPPIQAPVAPMNQTNEPAANTKALPPSGTEAKIEKKQAVSPPERNAPALQAMSASGAAPSSAGSQFMSGNQLEAPVEIPQAKSAPAQQAMNGSSEAQNRAGAGLPSGGMTAASAQVTVQRGTQTQISQESAAHTDVLSSKDIDTLALEGRDTTELVKMLPGFATASHLPGGAVPLSLVTRGKQVLAIGARNKVYLSNDGGTTWTSVRVPWKSHAVKAEVVSYSDHSQRQEFAKARGEIAEEAPIVRAAPAATPKPAAAPSAAAQNLPAAPPGSLAGTVTDETGAVIPRASVTVTNSATHMARMTETDGSGQYRFDGLAPGAYDLKAQAPGFETARNPVQLASAQANVTDIKLSVGAAAEEVTVETTQQNQQIQTTSPVSNETIASGAVNSFGGLPAPAPPTALFQVTTKNGQQWTSADGLTWKRK